MKKIQLLLAGLFFCFSSFALNIRIIESQSFNTGHDMDIEWNTLVSSMGHTPTISPQTTLDNTTFFASTDILIVSSGVITLPANRVNTILQFLQTGKPVYLQSEYLTSYTTNQAFASLVASLGGTFSWINTVSGNLQPTTVLGTYATTNLSVSSLSYHWYGVSGTGGCNIIPILKFGNDELAWQFVPPNPAHGTLITTTDQDWVHSLTSTALMQNLITHLINPPVINSAAVNVNLGNDTTLCNGGVLTLNASTVNSTYQWHDNSTGPTYTVTAAGTYFVTVMGSCGSGQDTITVNYSTGPNVNLGNDTTLCQGNTLTLNAATTNASYLWQNSSTGATQTVASQGLYWVQVTSNGCSRRDSISVLVAAPPTASLGNDTTLCVGNTITLSASAPTGSYLWQDNSTGSSLTVSTTGTYWVQAANSCGSVRDTINVNFIPGPNINIGNDTTLCQGNVLTLDATIANGQYTWQDNSVNPTFTVAAQGTYWVQVLASCGIIADTIVVGYSNNPSVSLGNDTTLCQGNTLVLNAFNQGAAYTWHDNSTTPTFNVSAAGTYWVQASNSCGIAGDTVIIGFTSVPAPYLGADTTLCAGNTLTLDATSQGVTYTWHDNSTNPTFSVATAGTYWVQLQHSCGTYADTISVAYTPLPTADLGNDTTVCTGVTLTLNSGMPGASYQWSNGSTNPAINVSSPGTYWVNTTNSCGTAADTITITHIALPAVDIGNDTSLCDGNTLVLNATTPGSVYFWSNNTTSPTLTVSSGGTYFVYVAHACGIVSDTIDVSYNPIPAVYLGSDTSMCTGEMLTLNATTGNATYQWQDNSSGAMFTGSSPGTYWVQVTVNGCSNRDTLRIDRQDCETVLIMPNVFTPNSDGKNDTFVPVEMEGMISMRVHIYNRWGNLVFTSENIGIDWNGESHPDGVYYWILTYGDINGNAGEKTGWVQLLR